MSHTVRILHEAEDELRAAAEWYDDRAELGEDLAAEVLTAIQRAVEAPEACALARGVRPELGARVAPVKRFPYQVVFVVLPAELRVVALAHARRRPGYWRARLSDAEDGA